MRKTPRGRISKEKGTRNAPTQSKGKKKKISLNTEEKKKKKKKEPDEDGMHKVQPSGQGKDKSTQTAPASLTKASSFVISRNNAAPTSSARYSSRKHTQTDTSAKEMLNLSNGRRSLLQERYKTSMQTVPADHRTAPCQEPSVRRT
ncbi:hypothetical protein PIB30_086250 [Stylosanthes scabra]|uniref:Uncharacterized protein n=1 Tax=Stylosanthes scabra TaxID=79078 RepID=A0ABU6XTP7_9FABA|nr:hypothetical protein [Stylosanthes scabra]